MFGKRNCGFWKGKFEKVRTRKMSPSYEDPTVQESLRSPLDTVFTKTKALERRRGKSVVAQVP